MRILVVGDLHIPYRAQEIPTEFHTILKPECVDLILATGNLCDLETHQALQRICPNVSVTRGEFDQNRDYPETITIKEMKYTIGVFHGHQSFGQDLTYLKLTARKLDANIIVYGASHQLSVLIEDDVLFVNPGSLTGAFHPSVELRGA